MHNSHGVEAENAASFEQLRVVSTLVPKSTPLTLTFVNVGESTHHRFIYLFIYFS